VIGLTFLAIALLWLSFSVFIGLKLPRWIGIQGVARQWTVTLAAVVLLLVGPFVDHIVGMWQFKRLCDEQTNLQIYPSASNAKRGIETSTKRELVNGAVIPINRSVSTITDLDTREVIAQYNGFSTRGGLIGGALMLGGEHVCSIDGPRHPRHDQYVSLKNKIHLTYGEVK
jgi:hypothetical protein